MRDAHQRLTARFVELKAERTGPIYFLEHGLDRYETEELEREVVARCGHLPPDRKEWRAHPLPLLVIATEVGYTYQGTGTDFWPLLSERLEVSFGSTARHLLRDLFVAESNRLGGIFPPETPWSSAFHLIAWPITHAVMPVELHRQFASTLANLNVSATQLDDDALHRALKMASPHPSARFATFLENAALAVEMSRSLLGRSGGDLTNSVFARIRDDLSANAISRRHVAQARRVQHRLRTSHPGTTRRQKGGLRTGVGGTHRQASTPGTTGRQTPTLPPIQGSLRLRRQNHELMLEATFPTLSSEVGARLRRALRRRRFAPRLWGVSNRIPSEQMLSGLPFRLKFTSVPATYALLIPGVHELDLDMELSKHLEAFSLPFQVPVLFAVSNDGMLAVERRGKQISGHRRYWALLSDDENPAPGRKIGQVGPFNCLELNPSNPSERSRIAQLGYNVFFGLSVLLGGDPPEHWARPKLQYRPGSRVIVKLRQEHPDDVCVSLRDEEQQLRSGLVRMPVPPGDHDLRIFAGDQERLIPISGSADARDVTSLPCWINFRGPDLTVQTLLGGGITIEIDGIAPIEGLRMTVEISATGHRTSVTIPIGPLPQFITSEHEVWKILLDDSTRARLLRAPHPTLKARVGALSVTEASLESRVSACWWSATASFTSELECETGPLEYGVIPATTPTQAPASLGLAGDEVYLLAPVNLPLDKFGPAASFTTLCVAPDRLQLGAPLMKKPRLRRQARARGESIGLEDLFESSLRWSLAETRTLTDELARSQVVAVLDRWTAELCCGEEWALAEDQFSGAEDPWETLGKVCDEFGLGRDDYLELTEEDLSKLTRLAVSEIRKVRPALWTQVGPPCDLDPEDYEALDLACGRAYEKLAKYYLARNKSKAELLADGDPGATSEDWNKALERVTSMVRRLELAALLLPTDTALRLTELDLSLEPPSAIVEELKLWAQSSKKTLLMKPPGEAVLRAIVALWTTPEDAVTSDWRQAIPHLLAERSLARAARYLSLLWRQQHRGGAA